MAPPSKTREATRSAGSGTKLRSSIPIGADFLRLTGLLGLAIVGFDLAYFFPSLAWLTGLLPFSLIGFALHPNRRIAFYLSLLAGLGCYAPKLAFFWTIFGPVASPLWLVLSFWLGVFGLTVWFLNRRLGTNAALLAAPVVWTAVEFFRSELYFLRFAWLTPGMAFDHWPNVVGTLGIYGTGFVLAAMGSSVWKAFSMFDVGSRAFDVQKKGTPNVLLRTRNAPPWAVVALLLVASQSAPAKPLHLAGAQLEFATHDQVLATLDRIVVEHPETELIVLSEYTFDDVPPKTVRDWCRLNRRHLVAGGKDFQPDGDFYNTAFVVGPDGDIVFRQAKCQPIQFFKDGKPAASQRLWESPWGRIGFAICYDDGYTHILDELVRQGAQLLIVPTMDVVEWGEAQHALHARLGPIRAAQYGIPVVRVCSSGVSQVIGRDGAVLKSLPFVAAETSDPTTANPRELFRANDGAADTTAPAGTRSAFMFASLDLEGPGRLPLDRWWVRGCVAATVVLILVAWRRGAGLQPAKSEYVNASSPASS
jgi:apolipoprotein N-acyltransferase